jgi:alkylation response protein AidB-like acyl-CoA dehydrogenase
MDTRDTAEQAELRRAARQVAADLGPRAVADLDDGTRRDRLAVAVRDAGWLELRDDRGDGSPLASAVEAAIVVDALGERVADVALCGPLLAADLGRRAGMSPTAPIAYTPDLHAIVKVAPGAATPAGVLIDAGPSTPAIATATVLVESGAGAVVGEVGGPGGPAVMAAGTDLTRTVARIGAGSMVRERADEQRVLHANDLQQWQALGLALTSADLVGVMRGVIRVSVEYAAERRQYGVPVGSFQAVQHLLAEAATLLEGAHSVAMHAAWAVDELEPPAALEAGRVAKAYCARAARTVCETAVQVHGGIGNTWECIVHVYLRRALLSTQWFGDDGEQLRQLERTRLAVV